MDLNLALAMAAVSHAGQTDKAGEPYILHVMRVVLGCGEPEERIVAALHDVLEDDPETTADDLRLAGFSEEVVAAVEAMTRRKGESYAAFIERVRQDPIAREVKKVDLRDNMDLGRIPAPTDEDRKRHAKYSRALAALD